MERDYKVKNQNYDRLRHHTLIGQDNAVRIQVERDYIVDEKRTIIKIKK
jgi:hypothetical protein